MDPAGRPAWRGRAGRKPAVAAGAAHQPEGPQPARGKRRDLPTAGADVEGEAAAAPAAGSGTATTG